MSGMPPVSVATPGLPSDIASMTTVAQGSAQIDGAMPTRARFHACMTSACGQLVSIRAVAGSTDGGSGQGRPMMTSGGAPSNFA